MTDSTSKINLQARDVQINPFHAYALIRETPACQLEGGVWAIGRYEYVLQALRSPEIFSSTIFKKLYEPDYLREECRRGYFILSQDAPAHTKNRSIVAKAFVHKVIDLLVPRMRASARALIAEIRLAQEVEFIQAFADPYIAQIIGHITGTNAYQDAGEIRRLLELTQVMALDKKPSDEHIATMEQITLEQREHFLAAIKARRLSPGDDFLTEIINAEVDGEKLDDEQLINLLDLLVHAGFHTATNALTHSIIQLSRHKDVVALLRENPSAIPAFIEEVLRFEPPSHNLPRETTRDVTIDGITIPKGAMVFLLLAAANRDPAQFPNPDVFIMNRPNIREHIAFGHGPHTCIGSALARLEIRVALEEVLSSAVDITCPSDTELPWAGALLVHAVTELPTYFRWQDSAS